MYNLENVSFCKIYDIYYAFHKEGYIKAKDIYENDDNKIIISSNDGNSYIVKSFNQIFINDNNLKDFNDLKNFLNNDKLNIQTLDNYQILKNINYNNDMKPIINYKIKGMINNQNFWIPLNHSTNIDIINNMVIYNDSVYYLGNSINETINKIIKDIPLDNNNDLAIKYDNTINKLVLYNKKDDKIFTSEIDSFNSKTNIAIIDGYKYSIENNIKIIGEENEFLNINYINKSKTQYQLEKIKNCAKVEDNNNVENWDIVNNNNKLILIGELQNNKIIKSINNIDYYNNKIIINNNNSLGFPSININNNSIFGELSPNIYINNYGANPVIGQITNELLNQHFDDFKPSIQPVYTESIISPIICSNNKAYMMISKDSILDPSNKSIIKINKLEDKPSKEIFADIKDYKKILDMFKCNQNIELYGTKGEYYIKKENDNQYMYFTTSQYTELSESQNEKNKINKIKKSFQNNYEKEPLYMLFN